MEFPLLFHHVDTTEESTSVCQFLIVDIGIDGQDGGMGVVGMQDDQLLMLPCTYADS